jgi:Domain of unknown function (DUF4129)
MSVRLRPRNAWEALDLGLELVRSNALAIYKAWLSAYVPVAIVVFALLWDSPFWALATMWWLKPAFDRVALAVVSRRLFGEAARTREILRSVPSVLWRSGIVGALTWRRLDLARSLHLPVYQLERLSGRAARARIRVLDREARGPGVWLTFLLANIEALFAMAVSMAVALLLPVQQPVSTLLEGWFRGFQYAPTGAVLGVLAACTIEPLYVACGFTLYLQRRTMLEGWDIELRFRQMTERIEKARRASAMTAPAIAAMLGLSLLLALALPAPAAEPPARDASREIREVLADPEFGHKDTVKRLKWVGPKWDRPRSASKPADWSWMETIGKLIAQGARALAWIAAAAAILFALYYLARYIRLHGMGRVRQQRPDFLFGLDVRPESLPDDVAGTAERLARESRVREALSLLYRASLVRFMDGGIEFLQGDTEGDCMRRVEAAETPRRKSYFRRLVTHWEVLAYGHHTVSPDAAVALARAWREQFPPEPDDGAAPQAQPA